jgi:hypothetical protein
LWHRGKLRLATAFVAFFAAALCPSSLCAADEGWDDFKPSTLRALIDEQLSSVLAFAVPNSAYEVFVGTPSRVRVTYTGKHRPLSTERANLLRQWNNTYTQDPSQFAAFRSEFLFLEGAEEHWLAVQAGPEQRMIKDLAPGDTVTLFVVLLGDCYPAGSQPPSLKGARPISWLFVVDHFE